MRNLFSWLKALAVFAALVVLMAVMFPFLLLRAVAGAAWRRIKR